MKLKNFHLAAIQLVLLALFLLSFTKSCSGNKRTVLKSALVNPKYRQEIKQFELLQNGAYLSFFKENGLWFVTNSDNYVAETSGKIPADSKTIENFLSELTKTRNLYKISDKISKNNTFGLTTPDAFCMNYHTQDYIYQLFFGNLDFSKTLRYFMTGTNLSVYQIDSGIEPYLTVKPAFWADQHIISAELLPGLKPADIQRIVISEKVPEVKTVIYTPESKEWNACTEALLELRHGGFPEAFDPDSLQIENWQELYEIKIDTGNKSQIIISCFSNSEANELNVNYLLSDEKTFSFNFKISRWTWNRLLMKD